MALHRLEMFGSLYTTDEFSMGISLDCMEPSGPQLEALETVVTEWFQSPEMDIISAAALRGFKINQIDPATGRYVDPNNPVTIDFDAPAPGSGTQAVPAQLSVAVSLTTAQKRGRGSRGRFYLPPQDLSVAASGHLSGSWCTTVAERVATFLGDVEDALDPCQVVIWSRAAHTLTQVTHVSVGDVIDTQRRRRNQIPEVYYEAPSGV